MNERQINQEIDNLNRTAKLFLDQGEADTFDESHELLRGYRLHADIRDNDVALQTALLTFINTASRFALGGVTVSGNLNSPLRVPLPGFQTVGDAVVALGGHPSDGAQDAPTVIFGAAHDQDPERAIKLVATGWAGGIAPAHMPLPISTKPAIAPAAVFAGAMAGAEGFSLLSGDSVMAGRRLTGLSLWEPERIHDWFSDDAIGPEVASLPDDFWLLGLGHLGQAFLWTVMVTPYRRPADVRVVLQDFDEITGSTISTSILSTPGMVDTLKTRAMSNLLEKRGFRTIIIERRFDGTIARKPDDPTVLICCVDNAPARKVIERARFPMVVEAGIGRAKRDFRSIRLHTFPANRSAQDIWMPYHSANIDTILTRYEVLASQGLDQCGLTRLANTAVGAPFVGAATGPLMYAQLLRILHGRSVHSAVDLDLTDLTRRRMVTNEVLGRVSLGFAEPAKVYEQAA